MCKLGLRLPGNALSSWWLLPLALGVVGASLLAAFYMGTQHLVRVQIGDVVVTRRIRRVLPHKVLQQMGIALSPEDRVEWPSLPAMRKGAPIILHVARTVYLLHDDELTVVRTHAQDVAGALADSGVAVLPHDEIFMGGVRCALDTRLPVPDGGCVEEDCVGYDLSALVRALRRPLRLSLRRAVPIGVQDGSTTLEFHTAATTVGEALYEQGIEIYAGDEVLPGLEAEIRPRLTVRIWRAVPVVVEVGGVPRMARTLAQTVAGLFNELQVAVGELDRVLPGLDAPLEPEMRVALVRVQEEQYLEEIPVPFETRWEPDPSLEIDQREIRVWGREGARRRLIRVRYENGRELYHLEQERWMAQEPEDRVIRYGTWIPLRTLDTPDGPITYWRHLRMLATSYSASTAGVSPGASYFGFTRLGLRARKGLVAVDPRVINLRQEVYIPGYGHAVAADTGSAIKWRRIDLCFDDDALELWHRWVDVYLLAPAPPEDEINWVIPNYPKERE
ncbi:MAG: DUF348 domain-containing protein [Chloroflexi bacterium]|nr:DUF348 domain-containing protein [Chloroflexota bacterium]